MNHLRLITGVILLLFAVSCEYEPKGVSERSLQPPGEAPELITLELDLPLDNDTAILPYRHIWYHFESPGHEINWIRWYIDASAGETVRSDEGFFELPNFSQPDGWHNLRLEVFISSGTGSLADSLEMEGTVVSVGQWVVKTLGTQYKKVTPSSKDGFLRLRWPPAGDEQPEYTVSYMNQEIGKTTASEFIVKEYVGQGGRFAVSYIDSRDGSTVYYGYVELPEENYVSWQADRNNNYYVSLNKLPYYSAVDTVVLVMYDFRSGYLILDQTTDPGQSSFTLPDSLFGAQMKIWMVVVPKYKDASYNADYKYTSPFATPRIDVSVGYPSPAFSEFFHTGPGEFVYHGWLPGKSTDQDYILRYSLLHDSIVDYAGKPSSDPVTSGTWFRNPSVSADGSWYTARIPFSQSAVVGSADNLSGYRIADLTAVTSYSYITPMPVSNTGIGIVISNTEWHLYDFRNDVVVASRYEAAVTESHGISADGGYIYFRTYHELRLFSWHNGILNSEHVLSRGESPFYDFFAFFPEEPEMAAGWDASSGTFYKIRCSDLSTQNSFPVPEEMILDIDFYGSMILSYSRKTLVVRSLDDGTLLHSIPVSISNPGTGMLRLCGGSIFYNNGLRYFLR